MNDETNGNSLDEIVGYQHLRAAEAMVNLCTAIVHAVAPEKADEVRTAARSATGVTLTLNLRLLDTSTSELSIVEADGTHTPIHRLVAHATTLQ